MKKMLCLASVFLCLGFNSAAMREGDHGQNYAYLLQASYRNISVLNSKAPHVVGVLQDLRNALLQGGASLKNSVPGETIGFKVKLGLATRFQVLQWLEDPVNQLKFNPKGNIVDTIPRLNRCILNCCENDLDLVSIVLNSLHDGLLTAWHRLEFARATPEGEEIVNARLSATYFVSLSNFFLSSIPVKLATKLSGSMFNLYKKTVTLYSSLAYSPGAPWVTTLCGIKAQNPGYFVNDASSPNKHMMMDFVAKEEERRESFEKNAANYEIKNGLLGLKRDILLKLASSEQRDESLRALFGIDQKMFEWRKHYLFTLGRGYAIKSADVTLDWLKRKAREYYDEETVWFLCILISDAMAGNIQGVIGHPSKGVTAGKLPSWVPGDDRASAARLRLFIWDSTVSYERPRTTLKELLEHIISDLVLIVRQQLSIIGSFKVSWRSGMVEGLDVILPWWRTDYPDLNDGWLGKA
jgi:hypothetical protein